MRRLAPFTNLFSGRTDTALAGLGYLFGPILGSALWRFSNRHTMRLIEARDRQFHQHIVKNRVDPSAQSATNPVPDFYGEKTILLQSERNSLHELPCIVFKSLTIQILSGEKIGSLHDYRQVCCFVLRAMHDLTCDHQWLRDQAKYKRKAALPED